MVSLRETKIVVAKKEKNIKGELTQPHTEKYFSLPPPPKKRKEIEVMKENEKNDKKLRI